MGPGLVEAAIVELEERLLVLRNNRKIDEDSKCFSKDSELRSIKITQISRAVEILKAIENSL